MCVVCLVSSVGEASWNVRCMNHDTDDLDDDVKWRRGTTMEELEASLALAPPPLLTSWRLGRATLACVSVGLGQQPERRRDLVAAVRGDHASLAFHVVPQDSSTALRYASFPTT